MARCAVFKCINGRIKKGLQRTEKVVYHKFPKNPKFAVLWWQATKRRRSEPCKSDFICSEHFTNDSYIRDLQHELLGLPPRKRLREDAIPTLNLPLIPQGAVKKSKIIDGPKKKRGRPKVSPINKLLKGRKRKINSEEIGEENEETENSQPINYDPSSRQEMRLKTRKTSYSCKEEQSKNLIEEITGESAWSEDTVQRLQNDLHCQTLLRNMFLDDALMDIALIAEDRTVKAHRAVLRQASGYFKQILSVDVSVESEITLKDIAYEDLVKIIGFIYLGEVSVRSSNLCRFLKTAERLEIFSLLPWSEDSEEVEGGCLKDKNSLGELTDSEINADRLCRGNETKKTANEFYTYDSNAENGSEQHMKEDPHSSDLSSQLDKRRESISMQGHNVMGAESQVEFTTVNRAPLHHFTDLYNKNYSQIVTESARESLHPLDTLANFGISDHTSHFNNSSSTTNFTLTSNFPEQSMMHHHEL